MARRLSSLKISEFLENYDRVSRRGTCKTCSISVIWKSDKVKSHKKAICKNVTEKDAEMLQTKRYVSIATTSPMINHLRSTHQINPLTRNQHNAAHLQSIKQKVSTPQLKKPQNAKSESSLEKENVSLKNENRQLRSIISELKNEVKKIQASLNVWNDLLDSVTESEQEEVEEFDDYSSNSMEKFQITEKNFESSDESQEFSSGSMIKVENLKIPSGVSSSSTSGSKTNVKRKHKTSDESQRNKKSKEEDQIEVVQEKREIFTIQTFDQTQTPCQTQSDHSEPMKIPQDLEEDDMDPLSEIIIKEEEMKPVVVFSGQENLSFE